MIADKIFIRGFIILASFFGMWFLLQQINWVEIIRIDTFKGNRQIEKIEKELGKLMISQFKSENEEVQNPYIVETVDSLVTRICESNAIDRKTIRVYVLNSHEVNAFALPDRQMVIYTGLIEKTEQPEALSGVIAHEMAHIEKEHVMKSLIREIGLGVLFALISGQSDVSLMADIIQMVSSSAFSREMEKEADLLGVSYLIESQINPKPFANFMRELSQNEFSTLKWISSHPMSKEREKYILESIENKEVEFKKTISVATWEMLKTEISNLKETTDF